MLIDFSERLSAMGTKKFSPHTIFSSSISSHTRLETISTHGCAWAFGHTAFTGRRLKHISRPYHTTDLLLSILRKGRPALLISPNLFYALIVETATTCVSTLRLSIFLPSAQTHFPSWFCLRSRKKRFPAGSAMLTVMSRIEPPLRGKIARL